MSKVMIDFLLRRRFPDLDRCDRLSGSSLRNRATELHRYCREVAAFEEALNAITPEFLGELFARESSGLPALEKKQLKRRVDHELLESHAVQPDFDFWLAAETWTREEAVALALDIDPNAINPQKARRLQGTVSSAARYLRLLDLAQRSESVGDVVRPDDFAQWMRDHRHECAAEFKEQFKRRTNSDTAELRRQISECTRRLIDFERERVDPRKYESLNKLLLGYAIGSLRYNPANKRNTAVGTLLQKSPQGLRVDEKTAKAHLDDAVEMFRSEVDRHFAPEPLRHEDELGASERG